MSGLDPAGIDPELAANSPLYQELANWGESALAHGVSPTTALTVITVVPVVLRVLRMTNEFVTAAVEVWLAEQKHKLERKRADHELEIADKRAEQERRHRQKELVSIAAPVESEYLEPYPVERIIHEE